MLVRYADDQFDENYSASIGVDFRFKSINIDGKNIKLQIWDTAGQEEFKAVTRSYYRSSAAALVVFDTTRKDSFRNVARWVEDIRNNGKKDVVLVLIGNKIDLVHERMVSRN